MKNRFIKFQNKFFFTFICLSLIPIIILTILTVNLYTNSIKRQTEENAIMQLENADETIYEKTKNVKRFIDLVRANSIITKEFASPNPNYSKVDTEMRNAILTCDGIESVIFLFPSSDYYSYNIGNTKLDLIKLQLLFNSDMRPNSFTWFDRSVENAELGINTNLITVGTIYEYTDLSGQKNIAKVYMFVNNSLFNQLLGKNFSDSAVTITDNSGSIITSNYPGTHFNIISNDFKVMRKIFETQEGVFKFHNKIDYAVTVYTSNMTDFKYISVMSEKSFYKDANPIIGLILFIILMFIVLFVLLYLFIIKKLTLPIKSIADTMKNFDDKSLGIRIPVKGNDEVSDIAVGYNKMMNHFNKMLEEIKESKDIQKDAEIKALSYQINPHFLYNALSAIRIEASNNNDEKVAENIMFLSKILKSVFSNTNKFITIKEELEISGYTVNLLALRYNKPISYKINYQDDIKLYKVPSMILQPIIENAVLHGLSKKMDNEDFQAKIDVTAEKENGDIIIHVIDNGIGMDDMTIKDIFDNTVSSKKGIGLFNVDERIKLLYGEDYGINIKSKTGIYTEVEMRFKILQND